MKKLYRTSYKTIAFLLFCISTLLLILGSEIEFQYLANRSMYLSQDYATATFGSIQLFHWLEYNQATYCGLLILCAATSALSFWFLLAAAGKHAERKEEKWQYEIRKNLLDKIPFDLYLLIAAFLVVQAGHILSQQQLFSISLSMGLIREYTLSQTILGMGLITACFLTFLLCGLGTLLTLVTRIRLHTVWKETLLYRYVWKGLHTVYAMLPLIWKPAIPVLVLVLLSLRPMYGARMIVSGIHFFCWVIVAIGLLGWAIYFIWQLDKLKTTTEQLADGNLQTEIRTEHLRGVCRQYAGTLYRLRDGMNHAVEARLQSERFRTELITNVSHDLKTPLTNIVNYVDLLSRETIENEKAKEYIETLERQAQRLQKLTCDLIEASKASTGSMTVVPEPVNLPELLRQAIGEYNEKLQNAGLQQILQLPEHPMIVSCDGKLLWRCIDNLLSNACKYALSGTRFYVTIQPAESAVSIIFRNIMREPLELSAEELSERFVRGDKSRSTEGSGLGLSIAKSLLLLQNGDLTIDIDGDLFKATITLPIEKA